MTRQETIEQTLTELRYKLENSNLSSMESYNIVRAIVHWEQVLTQMS